MIGSLDNYLIIKYLAQSWHTVGAQMLAFSFLIMVVVILLLLFYLNKVTFFSGVYSLWTCKESLLCSDYSSKSLTWISSDNLHTLFTNEETEAYRD